MRTFLLARKVTAFHCCPGRPARQVRNRSTTFLLPRPACEAGPRSKWPKIDASDISRSLSPSLSCVIPSHPPILRAGRGRSLHGPCGCALPPRSRRGQRRSRPRHRREHFGPGGGQHLPRHLRRRDVHGLQLFVGDREHDRAALRDAAPGTRLACQVGSDPAPQPVGKCNQPCCPDRRSD